MIESQISLALYFDQVKPNSIVILETSFLNEPTDSEETLWCHESSSCHPEPMIFHPTFSKFKCLLKGQHHLTQHPIAIPQVFLRPTASGFRCTDDTAATATHSQPRGLLKEEQLCLKRFD